MCDVNTSIKITGDEVYESCTAYKRIEGTACVTEYGTRAECIKAETEVRQAIERRCTEKA